ncbi:ATP-dependent DNA ligase [Streptomyces sp. TE33382]
MSHETHRSLENDGHRMVLRRTEDSVVLYARSGRIVTSHWMDLATPGMHSLLPGTVLDGEAVIWKEGKLDFSAVQSRAAATLPRARTLAARHPASYMVWDVLHHPAHGDVTTRPYTVRRALLVELLAGFGPPIQVVPSSDDYEVARGWYESLRPLGIEGIVAKRDAPYPAGRRGWCVDCTIR